MPPIFSAPLVITHQPLAPSPKARLTTSTLLATWLTYLLSLHLRHGCYTTTDIFELFTLLNHYILSCKKGIMRHCFKQKLLIFFRN